MRVTARCFVLVGLVALLSLACSASGGDEGGEDTGNQQPADVGEESVETPDTSRLPEETTPPVEEVQQPEDVPPCEPDCTDKMCGDDDGCGHKCVVEVGCPDKLPCLKGVCDKSGVCGLLPQEGPCDDGSVCTEGDFCAQGICKPGETKLDCDDGNQCTVDKCDPVTGCYSINESMPCDDGEPCTIGDMCENGTCVPGAANLCDDKNPCTQDSCQAGVGCQNVPTDGIACDDKNACTEGDQCASGKCQPGTPKACDDANPCTVDLCDPQAGCSNNPVPNATPCDDSDACTVGDFCLNGTCSPGGPMNCNDFNNCTNDTCKNGQCVYEKLTGDFYCSDDDPCTEPDYCEDGACMPGPKLPGCQ